MNNADEIVRALRWLAKETEFVFAAEQMNAAADLIESMQADLARVTAERDAAVADIRITRDSRCAACRFERNNGGACMKLIDQRCFVWRGVQAGEGETE